MRMCNIGELLQLRKNPYCQNLEIKSNLLYIIQNCTFSEGYEYLNCMARTCQELI